MDASHSSRSAPLPVGSYPHARRVGSLLFLSGMGPRRRGSTDIPGVTMDTDGRVTAYDIEAQTRSVFANIRAVLEEAGCSWESLVDVTVFLTDMKRDFASFNRVWSEHFPDPSRAPCRTTVEVGALPTPIHVELKAVAAVSHGQPA